MHEKHVHSTLAKQENLERIERNPPHKPIPYQHHIYTRVGHTECPALRTGNGGLKIFDGINSPHTSGAQTLTNKPTHLWLTTNTQ